MRPGIIRCLRLSGALLVAVAASLLPAGCTGGGGEPAPTVSVVTTLYPLEYFARRVGGERVTVVNLIGPGVEAHSFEPAPADIRRLDAADVVLYNGAGLEPWMGRALAATGGGRRVAIEVSRLGEEPDGVVLDDPHRWLDPLEAIKDVELVRDGLSEADPAGLEVYAANAQVLMGELSALHQRFAAGLESCNQDHFVTAHAAFGHLAARYGLVQVPISGLSPEAEPGPGDLASIADTIRELGVGYVMVEPIISTRFAEALAREVGAELLPLHPLESLTPDELRRGESYFTLMDANLRNLRLALGCRG